MPSSRPLALAVPLLIGLALGAANGVGWFLQPAQRSADCSVALTHSLPTAPDANEPVDAPVVLEEAAPSSVPDQGAAPTKRPSPRRARHSVHTVDPPADARPSPPVRGARPVRAAPPPRFDEAETYLLAGLDRTRSGGLGRADTLVVAVFDDASGHVGLVSIPRDLLVEVPGHGFARINATLRIAARLGRDPVSTLRNVAADVLGVPIDHVILGDLDVFERTVDALGGVEVDVPCAMRDDFVDPPTEWGRRLHDVPAGRVRMDGPTAAMYARSRHGRSDWDRARRQQALLFAMRGRVRELGAAAWLPVLRTASEHVRTDLSRLELLALVRRVAEVREDRLHGILLGHREVTPARTAQGQWVVRPDEAAIRRALEGLFAASAPGTPHVRARCQPVDAALRHGSVGEAEVDATEATSPTDATAFSTPEARAALATPPSR